jgi:hypothetical protein
MMGGYVVCRDGTRKSEEEMKKRRKEMERQKFPRREESKGKWRSGLFIWAAVDLELLCPSFPST